MSEKKSDTVFNNSLNGLSRLTTDGLKGLGGLRDVGKPTSSSITQNSSNASSSANTSKGSSVKK